MQRWLLFVLLLLLAGCSTVPEYTPEQLSWQQREAALKEIEQWQLKGRMAIQTEDDSWSGTLNWQQNHHHYDIHFSGPFGQGAMDLVGDDQRVVLTTSEGELLGEEGPERLLLLQTGWRVPILNLQYWIVGRPTPDEGNALIEFDQFGRIKQLAQSEWLVSYQRYSKQGGLELPAKLKITNHRLKVKLIISEWQVEISRK